MKIGRIVLCYADMDRIIVDKEEHLAKYDLSKVSAMDVALSMSVDEFLSFRAAANQQIAETGTLSNVTVELGALDVGSTGEKS